MLLIQKSCATKQIHKFWSGHLHCVTIQNRHTYAKETGFSDTLVFKIILLKDSHLDDRLRYINVNSSSHSSEMKTTKISS